MAGYRNMQRRITLWWAKATAQPTSQSFVVPADDGIADGVDYTRPVIVPGWMRRAMSTDGTLRTVVNEALRENMAQTYRSQFGNPYRTGDDLPIVPTTEDPLREWDWQTRERVLSNCHAAYTRNPLANAIVQYTADFVVGDGFNLTCKNKDVEAVLQAFIDNPDNAIREFERQAVIDLQVDGELVLRFFGAGQDSVMVPQRPWELHYIRTEPGFFRRALAYHFQREVHEGDDPTGATETIVEDVPSREVHFVAINRHTYELRGRPELYRLLPWLRADKEYHEEGARQHKWRNAIYWHVKVAGASAAVLAAVRSLWAKPPAPGSAYVSSDKQELIAVNNPAQGGGESGIGRSIRLMNILGARLPEYFFADGENANLASATKQELPALTKFEAFQMFMVEQLWTPVFKRVIQEAIDAGLLPDEVEEQDADGNAVLEPIEDDAPPMAQPPVGDDMPDEPPVMQQAKTVRAVDAFEVAYEPVTAQDLNALAQAYNFMLMNDLVSEQTAQEKLGLAPSVEQKRMTAERSRKMHNMAAGLIPTPPGMMGNPPIPNEDNPNAGDEGASPQAA